MSEVDTAMSNLQIARTLTDVLQEESRKRKHSDICEEDSLPPAKRRRLMLELSKRFLQKVREWHERRRKIIIGLTLHRDNQTRDVRRMARKRGSSELFSEYEGLVKTKYRKMMEAVTTTTTAPPAILAATNVIENVPTRRGLIKRLSGNDEAKNAPEVKVKQVQRRNGWRRKEEKRF